VKQDINLYQPMFRRQKRVFAATAMLQVLAAVLVGFLLIYAYGAWQVAGLAAQVEKLEQQRVAAARQLDKTRKQFPARVKSKVLEKELTRSEQEFDLKKRLITALSEDAFGNTKGFSPYLEGLARQHVQGTWLTGVTITNGGRLVGLAGRTLSPELVPVYVQKLSRESAFSGKAFNDMSLRRLEKQPNEIEFTLRTNTQVSAGKADG